jgi:hypothetical protein
VTGGTLGLTSAVAARAHVVSSAPVVMHGNTCTVVAGKKHRTVVGHAGDVVCAPKGQATLIASGPGTVLLIAGSGKVHLIAANDPKAHDILIGGTGNDTFTAGSQGDDVIDEGSGGSSVDCGSSGGASVTVVSDDNSGVSQGDDGQTGGGSNSGGDENSQNSDCQGNNVDSATMEFEGTVTAVDSANPPATVTISATDTNDGANTWLAANPTCSASALVIDLKTGPASIATDNGAPLAVGVDVQVSANAPAGGCSPVAVAVEGQSDQGGD